MRIFFKSYTCSETKTLMMNKGNRMEEDTIRDDIVVLYERRGYNIVQVLTEVTIMTNEDGSNTIKIDSDGNVVTFNPING